ncbi:MAG TPA: HAMP domain-containing sensor histidine kinase, partial [Candidatus Manganitrophaceae bacterium]
DLFETLRRTNRGLLRTKWALETANSQLKSLDQMKTNLLSNVSHELKTPMVAVKGYAGLILKGKAGPVTPLQKEYLEISLRNIQRQLALIDDLLNFSKLETGGDFFLMERINLSETLNESLHLIRPRAEEKKIGLEVHAAPGPHWVRVDRVKIGQVFNNLLSNAVKFTPERGKVTVAFKKGKNGRLNVSVSDTGAGIHPKKREKIFERFYQVESSESRRYGGIGLGLAITQDIVKRHGGQIKVAGQWGRGARFTFSLPIEGLPEAALPRETKGGERMERTGSMD